MVGGQSVDGRGTAEAGVRGAPQVGRWVAPDPPCTPRHRLQGVPTDGRLSQLARRVRERQRARHRQPRKLGMPCRQLAYEE